MKTQKHTVLALALVLTVAFSAYGQMHEHGKMNPSQKMEKSEMMKADYPLDFCIISGEKLGSMGDPVKYDYKGREIQFCCGGCVAAFEKDPESYLKTMDSAIIAAQKESYPMDVCVVSGEELGGDMGAPVDYVYHNQLVRFCCNACTRQFEKNPEKYLQKLHSARVVKMGEKQEHPMEGHQH